MKFFKLRFDIRGSVTSTFLNVPLDNQIIDWCDFDMTLHLADNLYIYIFIYIHIYIYIKSFKP